MSADGVFFVIGKEVRAIEVAETPPEAAQLGRITRQTADRQLIAQLQPVFDVSEKHIGLGENRAFAGCQQPGFSQGRERGQRAAAPQGRVRPARDKLHQLNRELNIADTTNPFLDIDALVPCPRDFLLQAPLVRLYAFNERLFDPASVDKGFGHLRKRRADSGVPRHKAHLQQRLPLPGFRPRFIVGPARFERPRDRSEPAFRPQAQVHSKDKPGVGRLGKRIPHRLAKLDRVGSRHVVAIHKDQINIRRIVQLTPTELAERKNGKRRVYQRSLFQTNLQGHPNTDIGKIADGPNCLRHVRKP